MQEEQLVGLVRNVHYGAAFVALVVAPIAMIVRKGGDAHRAWGKVFFWALVVLAVTAIATSVFKLTFFRAMVAVFALHLALAGRRSLGHKRLHAGQKPGTGDIVFQSTAGVVHGGLFLWGAMNLFMGQKDTEKYLFLFFGLAGMLMLLSHVHRFHKRSHDKHEWLFGHMTGMLAAYAVTATCFILAHDRKLRFGDWPLWSWPVFVSIPFIVLWVRHYQVRFSRGRRAKDVLELRIK